MRYLIASLILFTVVSLPTPAQAEFGLAQVCTLGEMATTACTTPDNQTRRIWKRPTADDAVAVCHLPAAQCDWGSANYERWADIPDTSFIHVCLLDLPPNQSSPCPGGLDVKPWTLKSLVAVPLVIVNGQGRVTLRWARPVQRADGSTLAQSDIAGYVIEWGTDLSAPQTIEVSNGTVTSSQLTLPLSDSAVIEFAMRTRDTAGQLSIRSNVTQRTFTLAVEEPQPAGPNPPEVLDVDIEVTCEASNGLECTFIVS